MQVKFTEPVRISEIPFSSQSYLLSFGAASRNYDPNSLVLNVAGGVARLAADLWVCLSRAPGHRRSDRRDLGLYFVYLVPI